MTAIVFSFPMVLLWGGMGLLKRPGRIALNDAALPTARASPKALVDEAEPLELFLEGGRQDAERLRGALLIAARRHQDGEDQIALEALKDVAQNQTLRALGFKTRMRFEERWIHVTVRHWRQDRAGAFARQWKDHSLRMNLRDQEIVRESGTSLAPQTNGMELVLSLERWRGRAAFKARAFNSAMKCACSSGGPRMLGAMSVVNPRPRENARSAASPRTSGRG